MGLWAVSGIRKYVKMKHAIAIPPRAKYILLSEAILISVISLNAKATIALNTQFVVAEREFADPITCRGYISEFNVHGVELIPNEKDKRKNESPMKASTLPAV